MRLEWVFILCLLVACVLLLYRMISFKKSSLKALEISEERRKSLEKKLQERTSQEKQLFQNVLEKLALPFAILDDQQKIVCASQAIARLFGKENVQGQSILVLIKNAEVHQLIEHAYQEEKEVSHQIPFFSPIEGKFEVTALPFFVGEEKFFLVTLKDVSELYYLESSRAKLLADVSHELRTPITSIKGFVETLLNGGLEDYVVARQFLDIIQSESDRLEKIVSDLLNLAKLDQKEKVLQLETVDLVSVIKERLAGFSPQLEEKSLQLDENLPSSAILQTDAFQWQQILTNLLSNAIRYTESGGRIGIALAEREADYELRIWDTGIGISEQHLDKIFDRFYRVNKGRSRQSGGTGLGLSLVKESIDALGATITVESQLNKGTCFTIRIKK